MAALRNCTAAVMQYEEHRTLSALLRNIAGIGHRIDGLSRFLKDVRWHKYLWCTDPILE